MQPSGQPPTNDNDIYYDHFSDSTHVALDFDTSESFDNQYAPMMPPPPPSELGFGQQLRLPDEIPQNQFFLSDRDRMNRNPPHHTQMPPQPPFPYSSASLNLQPYAQHQFQPDSDSEVGMHSQMEGFATHWQAGFDPAAAAPVIATSSCHYPASQPPLHLYHIPDNLGSFFPEYTQPSLTKDKNALLPPGCAEHARLEDTLKFNAEDTSSSQDARHNQRGAKKRSTATFHPYQWPPPKKPRKNARVSGSQPGVSESLPSMAIPPEPVTTSAPPAPPPDPSESELLYDPNNARHTRIVDLAGKQVKVHAVNFISLSTGEEREQLVQSQLEHFATAEYDQKAFGKKWASLNWQTLYLALSEPCRSIMHVSKKFARFGVQRVFRLRPPPRSTTSEPDHQKAAVEDLLDDTFPPKFIFGEDEKGDSHCFENELVWDILLNTVTELKLYDDITTLKSLFCTASAAVKCVLQELRTGRMVDISFSGVEYKPFHDALEKYIDNEIALDPVLSKRWDDYNALTLLRLLQILVRR